MGSFELPDRPSIPGLFLPFQKGLLIIDNDDLLFRFLAGLVTSFEGGQLRFISYRVTILMILIIMMTSNHSKV